MKKNLNLIPVIMCGGAGTRLWPLSRKYFPKQFVSLKAVSHNGDEENLFRSTVARASLLAPKEMVVVCNKAHRFFVSDNLHKFDNVDFSILVEPVSRNTAPAIAIAALEIRKHHGDGLMLVLPSDHIISDKDSFVKAVSTASQVAESDMLVTFGVVPEWAETGYGYIHKGEPWHIDGQQDGQEIYRAAEFCEKPDKDIAQQWLDEGGYYWNSGMFLFKASAYLEQLQSCAPEVYATCIKAYAEGEPDLQFMCVGSKSFTACPDISVDYAVMEKSNNVVLIPMKVGWNDVGSWDALASLLKNDNNDNKLTGDAVLIDSSNNIVYAGSRLVAMFGMKDCIVAETSDAVLVAQRSKSQDIKRLVETLRERDFPQANEHRKVYRPWGSYESVDAGEGFQVKRIIVNPKQSLSLQLHHCRSEHWVVVQGEVKVTCGEKNFFLGVNKSTYIPIETKHRLENQSNTPAHLIEVQCGNYLGEDDIERFDDDYGRTNKC